jgi:hypothetical protein
MSSLLAPYRSPEAREAHLDVLTDRLGGEVVDLGQSVEGRQVRAARVPASTPGVDEAVLVCAGIHGVEFIGSHVALALLESLASGRFHGLRERAEVWVVPSLNPDAYARTWAREGQGTLAELRTNARGVDLNRNFPLPAEQRPVWFDFGGWRTGSDDPANAFYRGSGPQSEPETRALTGLMERARVRASANLHSSMGTLIPPFVGCRDASRSYRSLCAAFRGAQRRPYRRMPGAGGGFDRFIGEQEDYQHHVHGAWSICVEHYPVWVDAGRFASRTSTFWRFNPRRPQVWVENDLPGIVAFLNASLDLPPPAAEGARVAAT